MIEVQGLVKTYGPVYAFVDDSAPGAVVNGLMRRHAFQFADLYPYQPAGNHRRAAGEDTGCDQRKPGGGSLTGGFAPPT